MWIIRKRENYFLNTLGNPSSAAYYYLLWNERSCPQIALHYLPHLRVPFNASACLLPSLRLVTTCAPVLFPHFHIACDWHPTTTSIRPFAPPFSHSFTCYHYYSYHYYRHLANDLKYPQLSSLSYCGGGCCWW